MGRSYFLRILVVSAVLSLFFTQGFGRKIENLEKEDSIVVLEDILENRREMLQMMDYEDPGPNTNPRTGYLLTPSPTSTPPAPPPQAQGSD